MAFDLKEFTKELNEDEELQKQFKANPQEVLKSRGLDITAENAEVIKDTSSSPGGSIHPNIILPIIISRS